MHHPTDRLAHSTDFVTPVVEHWLQQEIAQWVHPMKDQSDDPSHHEQTLLPRSYISLQDIGLLVYSIIFDNNTMLVLYKIQYLCFKGPRCSSVVECLFMVRWVIRSMPHNGPIELFLVPVSVPQLV